MYVLGQLDEVRLDDAIHGKMSKDASGVWLCLDCDYSHTSKQRVMFHIEGKHVNSPGHMCEICQKMCATKIALNLHRSRYHKLAQF